MTNEGEMYRLDRRDRYEVEDARVAGRSRAVHWSHIGGEDQGGSDANLARLYLSDRRDRFEQDDAAIRPVTDPSTRPARPRPVVLVRSAGGEEDPHPGALVGA